MQQLIMFFMLVSIHFSVLFAHNATLSDSNYS